MEAQTKPPKPFKKANDDDWVCADAACGNINFAWRTLCNRCSLEKVGGSSTSGGSSKKKLGHEIGKVIAEKSHGLFSPEDWQCNKCGNVNWARRSQCNVCNAPKFGEVEERTGLGGGYNERGTVEYKQRNNTDDDEYDDFGRRKKRRHGSSIHSEDSYQGGLATNKDTDEKEEEEKEEEEEEEDEEEDEEEEGDDEDLSKYDLSGWGDEDEGESKADTDENREADRSHRKESKEDEGSRNRSRSRSRSPIHRKN